MDKSAWANRLVSDPMFQELINDLKSVEIGKFVASDTNDIELREAAYIRLRVIEDIWSQLESMGSNSKINEKRWKIL